MGKKALIIISVIVLIAALVFAMYKLFRVRDFIVSGNETLSEEHVASLSKIEYDQHIIEVNKKAAVDAIEQDPLVRSAAIDIIYPDIVAITIEERKPAACIKKEDAQIVIDRYGYVLRVMMQTAECDYPLVTGLQLGDFQIGQRLGAQDTFRLDVLSRVLTETEEAGLGLAGIDVTRAVDIKLTDQSGLKIEIGDDTQLEKKIQLILSSRNELGERGKSDGILDVASASTAYYREK